MKKNLNQPFKRPDRVSDEIREILANIFISEIFIPEAGLLTVTKVNVTDDLKLAKIYISFLENKISSDEVIKIIKHNNNLIRHHLGSKLSLKYTPKLLFFYDNSLAHYEKIDKLIGKINKND